MFTAARDALTSRAAQTWANQLISPYGKVQDVRIDSRLKSLEVSCLLDGEIAPIKIRVENYTVESTRDKKFIRAGSFTCNRAWLQRFLNDHGLERKIELPGWAAAAL